MIKYEFLLENLNCASCAGKIENQLKNEFDNVQFNFVNKKLKLSSDMAIEPLKKNIQLIVDNIEDGVTVLSNEDDHHHDHSHKSDYVQFAAGLLLFIGGLLTDIEVFGVDPILLAAYIVGGYEVVLRAFKDLSKGQWFDEHFLMTIATFAAIYVGEMPEAVAVMLFYRAGQIMEGIAVGKSRKSIADMIDLKVDNVTVLDGFSTKVIPVEDVKVGDVISVKVGEKIPVDGLVTYGSTALDTAAITGESIPRDVTVGDSVMSGCLNTSNVINIKAEKDYGESTISKIMELLEDASSKKARTEKFITRFARVYTPIVVLIAALIAVVPSLIFGDFNTWIYRAAIFLVVSCPCALVISVPLGYFVGIGKASKLGVLIKGGDDLEALADLDQLVVDKTGTLTEGHFSVTDIENRGNDKDLEILSAIEAQSNHPIALSIVKHIGDFHMTFDEITEIPGKGLKAILNGNSFYVGNKSLMETAGVEVSSDSNQTVVFMAKNKEQVLSVFLEDSIKKDSKEAIEGMRKQGVKYIHMLTGDREAVAKDVSDTLQLDGYDSQLTPVDKVSAFEKIKSNGKKTGFVGDGLNDAPVLSLSDVGIAMGGSGTDASIEAADVVLMNDSLVSLKKALSLSKSTRRIVLSNIVFALAVKVGVILLGTFGLATMWHAVFADVGVTVLAVLNTNRIKS